MEEKFLSAVIISSMFLGVFIGLFSFNQGFYETNEASIILLSGMFISFITHLFFLERLNKQLYEKENK